MRKEDITQDANIANGVNSSYEMFLEYTFVLLSLCGIYQVVHGDLECEILEFETCEREIESVEDSETETVKYIKVSVEITELELSKKLSDMFPGLSVATGIILRKKRQYGIDNDQSCQTDVRPTSYTEVTHATKLVIYKPVQIGSFVQYFAAGTCVPGTNGCSDTSSCVQIENIQTVLVWDPYPWMRFIPANIPDYCSCQIIGTGSLIGDIP